jgi:amino acid adenylation domain-containing protein
MADRQESVPPKSRRGFRSNLSADRMALVRQLVEAEGFGKVSGSIPKRSVRPDPLPLSYAQQRLWFLDQLIPHSATYNIAAVIEVEGLLDHRALEHSIDNIIRRHETLRTNFIVKDGSPAQVIHPPEPVSLDLVRLEHIPAQDRLAEATEICEAEARRPFDLANEPLFRLRLIRLMEDLHWLLITVHHIVADGWSIGVMARDLSLLYACFARAEQRSLPDLPVQYADYTLWQQDWLGGPGLQKQIAYWKGRLDAAPELLNLPSDRPRPPVQSNRGDLEMFALGLDLTERLQSLCRVEGATLFMMLLTAFHILLTRYSGQQDIVIGSPVANRNRSEIEGLIGFFVNTLPLRIDSSGDPPFRFLLNQVRESSLEAFANSDVPFEKVIEEIQPERGRSRHPLFQVMFVHQNAPRQPLEMPGLRLTIRDINTASSKFDFLLSTTLTENGLMGSVEYDNALFDRETITRMLRAFEVLLHEITAYPEKRISEFMLLSDDERRVVLRLGTTGPLPLDCPPLHDLFSDSAVRSPHATAVSCEGQQLTYQELESRSNQLASHLSNNGAGPDVVVGICVERSIDMAVSVLGVLKAGAAYLPLDRDYPSERLQFMLADAQASILLMHSKLQFEMGPSFRPKTLVYIDSNREQICSESGAFRACHVDSDNLAYIIYTSGTTGKPKGACLPHRVITNLIGWQANGRPCPARTLQFASLSFDVSVFEMFSAWACAGELIICPSSYRNDLAELARFIVSAGIELTILPVAILQRLAEEMDRLDLANCCLRDIISTAERLQVTPALARLLERLPRCALHNYYGPSETNVATGKKLGSGPRSWTDAPSIGRPIPDTQAYILDQHLQPLPVGVPGELYLAGSCLGRGYWNRADITAERFPPNPFVAQWGSRMYRTGDLARWLSDGNIEPIGRVDHQLKVRGFRVEPAEVEATLAHYPAVHNSLVIAVGHLAAEKRLVAYVAASSVDAVRRRELRAFLAQRLPEYMIPSAFVIVDCLPLDPNGKIDLRGLPAIETEAADKPTPALPRNTIEELLCSIWADVLELPNVGIFDSFFDLGGHSLLATQLVARMRRALAVELSLQQLFTAPTVAAIAARFPELQCADLQQPPLRKLCAGENPPLSISQESFWVLDRLMPGTPFFNLPMAVRIVGPFDINAWTRALNIIVRRHTALRTIFSPLGRTAASTILPELQLTSEITDLSHLPEADRELKAATLAAEEAAIGFDLTCGPLVRSQVLRLGSTDHVALLTLHHIIGDGWSLEILRREMELIYPAINSGYEPNLPLPLQYGDYAAWQKQMLRSGAFDHQLAYWGRELSGLGDCELPLDRPRTEALPFATSKLTFELPESAADELRAFSGREDVTPFMVMVAAWKCFMYAITGKTDIQLGTLIANRGRSGTEEIFGLLVNTIVLRTDLSGDPSFRDLIARVRTMVVRAHANQDIPFEVLLDSLDPEGGDRSAIFRLLLVWENSGWRPLRVPGIDVRPLEVAEREDVDITPTTCDLWLVLAPRQKTVKVHFTYKVALFDAATVRRWWIEFYDLLQKALDSPDSRLSVLLGVDSSSRW